MQVFVIITNAGMMINVDANVKNWLIKVYAIKDMLGIVVIVSVNDKWCDFGEYLDYENCKCRKRLVDKLVEECTENIDEAKLTEVALFEHVNECICSYTVFIVLSVIFLTICIGIGAYFTYKYIRCNKGNVSIYDYVYQATNY